MAKTTRNRNRTRTISWSMEGIDDPAAARAILDDPRTTAATDMLHALKLAEGYFRDAARTSPQHFAGYLKAVTSAIAKAEGRK